MDSPNKLNPASTQEFSQMPSEDDSASTQVVSEVLAKNLGNLTLTPGAKFPSSLPERSPRELQDRGKKSQGLGLGLGQGMLYRRRRGVRTLEMARKERMLRMLRVIRIRTNSLLKKSPEERKREIELRSTRFNCTCDYCLYQEDPESFSMENNYDMESIKP